MTDLDVDLVAVGGGTGGLVAASGAAYLGARPALVERSALGGDCLWTGCVPSKALLASARLAHAMRHADDLGLTGASPGHAFGSVMERMRRARATVARHDDPDVIRARGIDVRFGDARFVDEGTLEVEGVGRIRSPRIIVATGASPSVPPIPGLDDVDYLTHETAFDPDEDELPDRIVMLGGGPVGLEFAQVYARLGASVTVVEMAPEILSREDPEAAAALRAMLSAEGVEIRTGTRAIEVEGGGRPSGGDAVLVTDLGERIAFDRIFVATGRRPASASLQADRAGIETDGAAISVDRTLRTTAPGVWAVGDVTGGPQFTHLADYMARTALRNALLPFSSRVDYSKIPRVTYTDPEVAHVGMDAATAKDRGHRTYRYDFEDLDRAVVDARTEGFVKIHADRKGRILGSTIVAHDAGNLLQPIVMAMTHGLGLKEVSDTVYPYPTLVEGVKRAADAYQRERLEGLGGTVLRKVVSWLT